MTFVSTSNGTRALTTELYDDYQWPIGWNDYLWATVVLICIFVGLVGNITLIYIILRNDSMRNTRNLLICNIAVGDMLLIVSYPTYTFTLIFPQFDITWTDLLCKFFKTWLLISQGISVFSLTWLSVERYQAFSTTQRSFVSRYVTLITVSIWIVSVLFTSPIIIRSSALDEFICLDFPEHEISGQLYAVFQFAVLYVIPLFIIIVHYCRIIDILFKSIKMMPLQTSNRQDQLRRRRRSSLVLSLITIIFAVCWLPFFIRSLLVQFSSDDLLNELWLVKFKQFSEVMVYISACINPVTLFLISKRHRHYFKKYLCCASTHRRTVGLLSIARPFFSNITTRHTQTLDMRMRTLENDYSCVKQEESV